MPIDFPSSPALNEIYTYNGRSWIWNGTSWNLYTSTNFVNTLNGFTGGVTLAAGTYINISSSNGTITISSPGDGPTGYVASFNGNYGAIQGISAAFGGTGISVSGATGNVTIRNTGVLSINGDTGSILNVAKINTNNFFTTSQDISGSITVTNPGTFNNISLDPNTGKITFYEDSLGNIAELYTGGYNNQAIMLPGSSTTLAGLAVDPQTFTGTNTFNTLTRFPGGISAAGATFSSHVRFLSGFSAGVGAGNCFMSFNPASSANNGGLWIQNGNLQLAGSAFGAGNGSLQYSVSSEYLNLYGFAYINNSYNYQAARVPLRLNAAPTQSVPIFAAYKQTVEGTAITSTYSATNMVAGIDNNGALFSSVGLSAAGGITFSSRINFTAGISGSGGVTFAANVQAATYTETSNFIRLTNNARSWFL